MVSNDSSKPIIKTENTHLALKKKNLNKIQSLFVHFNDKKSVFF